jgi:nicotinamidase-related amidase
VTTPVLVVVDLLNPFEHEDADALMQRLEDRAPALGRVVDEARRLGWPVVYVNDDHGEGGDPERVVLAAITGRGGSLIAPLAPRPGEPVLLKPGYSAWDRTSLPGLLRGLGAERVVIVGTVIEMCVLESARDARRDGLGTTVVGDASVPLDDEEARRALETLAREGVAVVASLDEIPEG